MKQDKLVKIEVRGGIAEVVRKSSGITVEIIDWDNIERGDDGRETYEAREVIK